MKTIDQILLETHGSEDFSYHRIRKAMVIQATEAKKQLYPLIFIGKQWQIWEALGDVSKTTSDIVTITGIESKNVSTQLNQMARTGLIFFTRNGKLKTWHKKP